MVHFGAQIALAASIATLVAASPVERSTSKLPVQKRAKSTQYLAKDVVTRDKARIAHYNGRSAIKRGEKVVTKRASSGPATNEDVQ